MGGGGVSSVREGGQEPADGGGPRPVVQWRLPLTGSVSYRPGRHGRASQTAAVLKLHRDKHRERKLHVNIVCAERAALQSLGGKLKAQKNTC